MVRKVCWQNEDTEQQFSEFLHNEILHQNVMAIEISINIVAIKLFGEQINLVEELVQRIRERMDLLSSQW